MLHLSTISLGFASLLLAAAHPVGVGEPVTATAELRFPLGLAWAPDGRIFVSERGGHRVSLYDPSTGEVEHYAGTGEGGFSGDGGKAVEAQLQCPDSIDTDVSGNLYIADRCNERIRRVDWQTGLIETVAGTGESGPAADGAALETALTGPFYLRVDDAETILFTDTNANLVRVLDLANGSISTLAGTGEAGFSGDGGPAIDAQFQRPHVVLRLADGNILIADSMNQRLREVDRDDLVVRTIAGNGDEAAAIDGASALETPFFYFGEVLEQADRDLLFTEWWTGRVWELDRSDNVLRLIAGSEDDVKNYADAKSFNFGPTADMLVDADGNIYVANARQGAVRRINVDGSVVDLIAGSGD